ncbi:MAG: SGNH/GDSL hydrolase family protein [Myxococcota bacterium]
MTAPSHRWIAICSVLAAAGCGVGILASAPWITDADNDDVVFLGDSIFALSGDVQADLYARNGGTFRNYTTSGAELVGGFVAPSVTDQFALSGGTSPIVVMDGGGNDILIPVVAIGDPHRCNRGTTLTSSCRAFIDDLYVEIVDFLDDLADAGVQQVVYLGYYTPKDGLLGAGDLQAAVDYGDDMVAQACAVTRVDCTFVDPRGTLTDADIVSDGVHPTASGSAILADLLWAELEPRL